MAKQGQVFRVSFLLPVRSIKGGNRDSYNNSYVKTTFFLFSWNSYWELLHSLHLWLFRNDLVFHSPYLIYTLHLSVVTLYLLFFVQLYLIYYLLFVTSNLGKPYSHLIIILYAHLKGKGEKKQFDSLMCILMTAVQGALPSEHVEYY